MATFREEFLAFMDKNDVKYTELDERAVSLSFSSDVVPQGVRVLVIFDSDNKNTVHFIVGGIAKVPEAKFAAALLAVNEANSKYRWVKFYIDDEMSVIADDDAVVDMNSVGQEIVSMAFRMSDIVDDVYPSFMKAIYT